MNMIFIDKIIVAACIATPFLEVLETKMQRDDLVGKQKVWKNYKKNGQMKA